MIVYLFKFPIIFCFSPPSTPSPPQVHFHFHVFSVYEYIYSQYRYISLIYTYACDICVSPAYFANMMISNSIHFPENDIIFFLMAE